MGDSYQAVYDAVRSRISNANVGDAVESALRDANISHYADMASRSIQDAASAYGVPSAIMRPALTRHGTMWMALYGENLMDGVAGFGETPAKAMADFDVQWFTAKTPAARRADRKATGEQA